MIELRIENVPYTLVKYLNRIYDICVDNREIRTKYKSKMRQTEGVRHYTHIYRNSGWCTMCSGASIWLQNLLSLWLLIESGGACPAGNVSNVCNAISNIITIIIVFIRVILNHCLIISL